jgi:hypothetical protein
MTLREELENERRRSHLLIVELKDTIETVEYLLDLVDEIHQEARRLDDLFMSCADRAAISGVHDLRSWLDEELYDPMVDQPRPEAEVVA